MGGKGGGLGLGAVGLWGECKGFGVVKKGVRHLFFQEQRRIIRGGGDLITVIDLQKMDSVVKMGDIQRRVTQVCG